MKTYDTNCRCPKCRKLLKTSDIEEYTFVCLDCDENFYGIEIREVLGNEVKVTVCMDEDVYTAKKKGIQELAWKNKCKTEYDDICRLVDFIWDRMPSAEQMMNVTKGIEN